MPTEQKGPLPEPAPTRPSQRDLLFPDLDEAWFLTILAELIERNQLACRAVLSLARVRFTTEVPTLAVTLTRPVELLVNLEFVRKHCGNEAEVEAVLLHEFLHVLLGHTERFERMNPALNIALDAVINAVIHRSAGWHRSQMFARYYGRQKGVGRLLRPPTGTERDSFGPFIARGLPSPDLKAEEATFAILWTHLYDGRTCADDILDLMEAVDSGDEPSHALGAIPVIGSHAPGRGASVCRELADALGETMKQMNGDGIWRSPRERGVGHYSANLRVETDERLALWERTTWNALRRALLPDRRGQAHGKRETDLLLPILSPRDRRGFVRALWSPVLPENRWTAFRPGDKVSANVYLDVSGSMYNEMPSIIGLLSKLRPWITMPFWAFSDDVSPATIENGRLVTESTGGTAMSSVLRHLVQKRPARALVVTDGYIERVDPDLLAACSATRIHALVTRQGTTRMLDDAGIPVTQLEAFPAAGPDSSRPAAAAGSASNPRPVVVRR